MGFDNKKPVVHCITNIITVNDCANVLHAIGAAPVMAHHPREVAQVAASADALVINLGATEDFEAMKLAMKAAGDCGKPIVIDPVGAGGIDFRREMFAELITIAKPTCVRGNMSEIKALFFDRLTTVGVDARQDELSESKMSDDDIVRNFATKIGSIVVGSGPVDIISDGSRVLHVEAGSPMLTRITGAGCMSTAMIGGYLGAMEESSLSVVEAVKNACTHMGECGKLAAEQTKREQAGIMTFHTNLLDQISLYN